jgi:asparagine synthase (glutamine-hydrolysing)
MTDTLFHRGPDAGGTAVLPGYGVAIGMRRLSILDIEGGVQPMWNEDRSVGVVFNGEVYNWVELRRELASLGHRLATDHSDTEVFVHGWEEWGPDLFPKLNGMFAVAIWDERSKGLVVARDRVGKKPLYIGTFPGGHAFGSELKALLEIEQLSREIDLTALNQYLSYDYVLGPRSIFRDIQKLGGGEYATITSEGIDRGVYWEPAIDDHAEGDDGLLLDELDALLDRAVARRVVADVPVGLFLSGGLDSTTVGYYMRRHSEDVLSFSIAFEEDKFDESKYAERAARALGTRHHVELMSQQVARDLVVRVPEILDEPMGDQSIFPTYLLSSFTRRSVTVALGGDGSDELLMGYESFRPLALASKLDRVPHLVRAGVAGGARRVPAGRGRRRVRGVEFARLLDQSPSQRLLSLLGANRGAGDWLATAEVREHGRDQRRGFEIGSAPSAAQETVAAYLRGYLQEDILVKVDRASMAASLEVRAPFLDPDLVEFLLSVPTRFKRRNGTGKVLLRQLMRGRVPNEVIDRPKVGFGVPLDSWLRGSLAPLLRELLAPSRLQAAGFFDHAAVDRMVDQHVAGSRNFGRELWLLLQFELWRERWVRT